jgi:hypothetical protein
MSIPLNYSLARFLGHQHYIRRGRDRLIRRFAQPSANAIPFAVDFFGLVYRGDLSNFIDWSVYIYGAYSRNELLLLRDIAAVLRSAQPNVNFYDIGASTPFSCRNSRIGLSLLSRSLSCASDWSKS